VERQYPVILRCVMLNCYTFLTDASVEDAGTYVCKVENVFGKAQYETSINITGIGE
jgi:hypothetical protein